MSSSLWPHELQHARLPSPSLSPRICLNSCPLSRWCHPTISSSITPSSSLPQSFLASGSLPMSQLFASGGQNIRVSSSALPKNIQSWFLLRSTDLISSCLRNSYKSSPAPQRKNDLESETTNIKYSKLFGVITALFLQLFLYHCFIFYFITDFFFNIL